MRRGPHWEHRLWLATQSILFAFHLLLRIVFSCWFHLKERKNARDRHAFAIIWREIWVFGEYWVIIVQPNVLKFGQVVVFHIIVNLLWLRGRRVLEQWNGAANVPGKPSECFLPCICLPLSIPRWFEINFTNLAWKIFCWNILGGAFQNLHLAASFWGT